MGFADIVGHDRPIALLRTALRSGRVAHAYLFHGEEGIGKGLVALRFAQALLCESPPAPDATDACGLCRACCQVEARTHPDFLFLEPDREAANPQIKIEQIRELESQVVYRPLIAARKVFIIDEADRLTIGAANALLKTLEEPPSHSLFLLTTGRLDALPATVRSRCQRVRFTPPAIDVVQQTLTARRGLSPADAHFLAMHTQGRIGQALEADPAATRAQEQELCNVISAASLQSAASTLAATDAIYKSDRGTETLAWLAGWVRDLILTRAGADDDLLLHRNQSAALRQGAQPAQLDALLDLFGAIDDLTRGRNRNLNLQLGLESALLGLRDVLAPTASTPSRIG